MIVLEILKRMQNVADAQERGDPAAHAELLKEIHNLQMAVETPAEKTMRIRLQVFQNICIRLCLEYGILQAIAARKGAKVTAAEISQETGAPELLITRLMRLVTFLQICHEVDRAAYAANECTVFITQEGIIGGHKHTTDLLFPVAAKLVEMKRKHGIFMFPEGSHEFSPFQYAYGDSIFEHLAVDKEQKQAFDDYMSVRRAPQMPQWFEKYPADRDLGQGLKEGAEAVLVVDVGGGKGHEMIKFRRRFPNLSGKVVIQDRPETIRNVDVSATENVDFMAHDFFTEQPIKGARIYYLRGIMHDWSDEKCKSILGNIVAVMDPDYSRILIDEFVLGDTDTDARAAATDIMMMLYASGIERTAGQWEALLGSVNLELYKIHHAPAGFESIIEARKLVL